MANFSFSDEDRKSFHKERFEHPHPRVQQRMKVLWLISQGLVYLEVARLARVSGATVGLFAGARHRMGHHYTVWATILVCGSPAAALPLHSLLWRLFSSSNHQFSAAGC